MGTAVVVSLVVVVVFALSLIASGLHVIAANETGLVIRRFGTPLPPGRLIALEGEAGYQADLLPPGWHFWLWPWRYKVTRVPLVVIPAGEIGLVVAADGEPIPAENILAHEVECDDFQDARAFLTKGGERGRQLGFLRAGTYRINPALFEIVTAANAGTFGMHPSELSVFSVPSDKVGIVSTLDGRPIATGDLAAHVVEGHDNFQRGQAFIEAGGGRGLQEQVLLAGSWNLNPWFVRVELAPMTEIPIGFVGVVVSYVGKEHIDLSGEDFTHGDLVERGRKGVWIDALLPGRHPVNARVMKVELVPTTNIVLNWSSRIEQHKYDEKLGPVTVRSKDGFSFTIDVSQIIHIGMRQAPRVISRVGSMQNLVDHVLQPTVANYFRNSAQQVTVLEFLSARSQRQQEAFEAIKRALAAYDIECIDTLIGDIQPPAELMKTQTDRKIAEELQRTYEVQREAQTRRQQLERETAVANMQAEVVRSEQMVAISQKNALAMEETARGDAARVKLAAEAEAQSMRLKAQATAEGTRLSGEAEAHATRATGLARAEAAREGVAAVGTEAYVSLQVATVLGENQVKLVPEIAVGHESGLANAFVTSLLRSQLGPVLPPPRNGVHAKEESVLGTGAGHAPASRGGPVR